MNPFNRSLLVEGWRFIPHSYSVVNQFQLLSLSKKSNLDLYYREKPYYRITWNPTGDLFSPESEEILQNLQYAADESSIDALLRISYPYDCSPSSCPRTFVFGTAEFLQVPNSFILNNRSLMEVMRETDFHFITPSNWSKKGFLHSGCDPDRVHVVPHGFDPQFFHPPIDEQRSSARSTLGLTEFTFTTIGALTGNKGITQLLQAFAVVLEKYPNTTLMIKGLDAIYPSQQLLMSAGEKLPQSAINRIQPKLKYIGSTLTVPQMAQLYHASDAYVSPYHAEGFNLPVLEATACATPVICTQGGPTDDFTSPDFTLPIQSQLTELPNGQRVLQPSLDSLIAQMILTIESHEARKRAAIEGAEYIKQRFTWDRITDQLLQTIFL